MSRYSGFNQQDAHEFLIDLIDCLHDEMKGCLTEIVRYGDSFDRQKDTLSELSTKRPRNNDEGESPPSTATTGSTQAMMGDIVEMVAKHVKCASCSTTESEGSVVLEEYLPTSRHFLAEVEETFTCTSCMYSRSKKVLSTYSWLLISDLFQETYRDISLVIDNPDDGANTLKHLLNTFFRKETRQLTCEKCGGLSADVESRVTTLPNALILHLKRFSYNET